MLPSAPFFMRRGIRSRTIASETTVSTEESVTELFNQCGVVRSIKLATDIFSGDCRGFATVDMEGHEARAAIAALDGSEIDGRQIYVSKDMPRKKGAKRLALPLVYLTALQLISNDLLNNFGNVTSTNRTTTFTDGETTTHFHRHRDNQLNSQLDIVTRHHHLYPLR